MCPPVKSPPPPDINLQWSNEQLILLVDKYTAESNLPSNVLTDLSPYQHPPSNLPEGIWYIVRPGEKKESAYGFWKVKGEPCKIYSNSSITGWKTILEYFEGQMPYGQKTNWVMQEYSITRKELCDNKRTKDSRLLCRVFHCSEHSSESDTQPHNCKTEIDLPASISPNINSPLADNSSSESKASEMGLLPEMDDDKTNFSPQDSDEEDCISRGDFLELNDLVGRESESSSSQNSSCTSNLSDEYFDPVALLREIVEDEDKRIEQGKQASSKHSFMAPVGSNNIVLQPTPAESQPSDAERIELIEGPQTGSANTESLKDKTVRENAAKRHNSDSRTEGPETTSSDHKNAGPSGEKKTGLGRLKKLKLFFCFSF